MSVADDADGLDEEALRAPTAAALRVVVMALGALVVGTGVALLVPGTRGLYPVDGPVSWTVSTIATGFVAFLANLVTVVAWAGVLAWVAHRRGRRVHALVALATAPFALAVSFATAVAGSDEGLLLGMVVAAGLLGVGAVAAWGRDAA